MKKFIPDLLLGAVGLCIARELCKLSSRTTFLVERNASVGQETSSRNSEVIHAGIYYPRDSLKTRLCCRGRKLLYQYLSAREIPHRKIGKLVVATNESQRATITKLHEHATVVGVPTRLLNGNEARQLEPDLSESITVALHSPETGILSSHDYMASLETDILDSGQGDIAFGTEVVRVDASPEKKGWIVQTKTGDEPPQAIHTKVLINSAGLNSHTIDKLVLGQETSSRNQYYCKGSYFAYSGPGVKAVKRLIYPVAEKGLEGLGTHLTMNMAGEIRFGPDVEYLEGSQFEEADSWKRALAPSAVRLEKVFEAVQQYLPNVALKGLRPDYAGIRPKLSRKGEPAADFSIQHLQEGYISLMGIESPGLTSSMAIGEEVGNLVKSDIHGLGRGSGRHLSELGNLKDWE